MANLGLSHERLHCLHGLFPEKSLPHRQALIECGHFTDRWRLP